MFAPSRRYGEVGMKRFILTLIILTSLMCISAEHQISVNFGSGNRDGDVIDVYTQSRIPMGTWTWINTLDARTSESTGDTPKYYLRNYLRDRINAHYIDETTSVILYGGFETLFSDNSPTYQPNLPEKAERTFGVVSGFSFEHGMGDWVVTCAGDYDFTTFEAKNQGQSTGNGSGSNNDEGDNPDDANAAITAECRYLWNEDISLFTAYSHENDLNESDLYDYTVFSAGVRWEPRFSIEHALQTALTISHDDMFDNLPWWGRIEARHLTRIGLEWALIQRADFRLCYDRFEESLSCSDGFVESMVQYTFGFDEYNLKDYIGGGVTYHPIETVATLVIRGQAVLSQLILAGDYRFGEGDDTRMNHLMDTRFAWMMFQRSLRLGYAFRYESFEFDPDQRVHSLFIEAMF